MINREEIDHMARLMAIMNGEKPQPINESKSASANYTHHVPEVDPQQDMKNILSRMYEANGETDYVAPKQQTRSMISEESSYSPPSYNTGSGYHVGVTLKEGSKSKRLYSVMSGSNTIIDGLNLFESAYIINHYLNNGRDMDDRNVQKIMNLEEDYRTTISEAIILKQRINRCKQLNESEARSVFEKNFKKTKAEAEGIHETLKARMESLIS